MAELLRTGNTMLNLACPICNNPIFRNKKGEIFCAICNRPVKIIKDEIDDKEENTRKKIKENGKIDSSELSSIKNIILSKLNRLAKKLSKEEQIDLIDKYIRLMRKLLLLLKEMNSYN
ncbi:MAG: Sjogren's syndrome/scleroderma autoantigen 1 family protein [Promethearchaeota archaeon]